MPSKSEYYLSCLNIVSKDISLELINKNLQVNEDLKMPGLMFKNIFNVYRLTLSPDLRTFDLQQFLKL